MERSRRLLLNSPGGVFRPARFNEVLLLPRTTRNSMGFSLVLRVGRRRYIS
jgi:hypothetical protein